MTSGPDRFDKSHREYAIKRKGLADAPAPMFRSLAESHPNAVLIPEFLDLEKNCGRRIDLRPVMHHTQWAHFVEIGSVIVDWQNDLNGEMYSTFVVPQSVGIAGIRRVETEWFFVEISPELLWVCPFANTLTRAVSIKAVYVRPRSIA